MKSPGQRIKSLREEKGLTQEGLASELESSKMSIFRYDKDLTHIDTHTLIKACLFFNVTSDYILALDDHKTPDKGIKDNHLDITNTVATSKSCTSFFDEDYFWITKNNTIIGAQTKWVGFTEDGKDIRVIQPIIPDKAKAFCEASGISPMIINSENDVFTYSIVGGRH